MPDGETISLHEHDGVYTVRVGRAELMSTRRHASEDRLAELACAHLANTRNPRVLIGGLGFGFTLKAALAALPADASVTVAEISEAMIAWNRDPALPLAAAALSDARVTTLCADVTGVILRSPAAFDAIILDVDNGPDALSTTGNARLYDFEGLRHIGTALRPHGCAAFWSAAPDPAFARLMTRAGFSVDVERARAHTNSGGWHTLFIGRL